MGMVIVLQKVFYKRKLFANHGTHEEHTLVNKTFLAHYKLI